MSESSMPVRIQLSRQKGWRMPPNTVRVSRPGKWGNPFTLANEEGSPLAEDSRTGAVLGLNLSWPEARRLVVDRFRAECVDALPLKELRGKNLACWCALDQPCHADVLLELANRPLCEAVA